MLLDTKYLGEVEIDEEMIIHFESGIPGFQDEKEFAILDIPGNDLIQMMQSVKNSQLAFFITNPHYFYRDYAFSLDDHTIEVLDIKDEKEVVILAILTIADPFEESTINLQAPVIINSAKKMGKQYILTDEQHPLKAKISVPNKESGE